MRTIKFRAWDAENQVLVYSDNEEYLFGYDGIELFIIREQYFGEDIAWATVDDVIFMQYTGFEDDNGAKIYDGDIVKCVDEEGKISKYSSREGIGPVKWSETHGCWVISNINNLLADIVWYGYIEIIGNIYEDGHLLKK